MAEFFFHVRGKRVAYSFRQVVFGVLLGFPFVSDVDQLSLWNLEGLRLCPWHKSATLSLGPRRIVLITLELSFPFRLRLLSLVIAISNCNFLKSSTAPTLLYTSRNLKDNKKLSTLDHSKNGSLVQTCTRNLT